MQNAIFELWRVFAMNFCGMNKVFVALCFCVIMSLVPLEINNGTLTVFYSLAGVLFSVGMSLVISFNSSRITSLRKRTEIRKRVHSVRNTLISVILMATIVFVAYSIVDKKEYLNISWYNVGSFEIKSSWSFSVLLFLMYCCVVFVSNYIDIQDLYEDIDDKIQREDIKKKKG